MKKNKFYPLGGTTVFLVDQWAKHYVEKNLKMGEKRKLTDRYQKEKVVDYIGVKTGKEKLDQVTYNLGDFAIGAGGVLWVLGSMFKKGKEL
ncbi:MAG: hypothetical protein KH845_02960 [Clostridiales bacterium]|nr:hypothetical protein [Clostridiales bacterium]